MDFIKELFSSPTAIGIVVTLVGGWLLKKFPGFDNRFIPIATFVSAVLTQLVNFFAAGVPGGGGGAPADSTLGAAGATYLQAGFFDGSLFKAVAAAVLQWVFTDKLYVTQKKAIDGVQEVTEGVPLRKSEVEKG